MTEIQGRGHGPLTVWSLAIEGRLRLMLVCGSWRGMFEGDHVPSSQIRTASLLFVAAQLQATWHNSNVRSGLGSDSVGPIAAKKNHH